MQQAMQDAGKEMHVDMDLLSHPNINDKISGLGGDVGDGAAVMVVMVVVRMEVMIVVMVMVRMEVVVVVRMEVMVVVVVVVAMQMVLAVVAVVGVAVLVAVVLVYSPFRLPFRPRRRSSHSW